MSQSLPTFVKVKDYLWLYEPPAENVPSTRSKSGSQPDTILLFTWLFASLRTIAKYTEGYKILFPSARIIVVTGGHGELVRSINQVKARMKPAIKIACGPKSPEGNSKRLLVQNLSNGGSRNLEGALRAYKEIYGAPMAPPVLITDSTPSNPSLSGTVRGGTNMFNHTLPKFYPARIAMYSTYFICIVLIFVVPVCVGFESMLSLMRRDLVDPRLLSTKTRRTYIYSKTDQLTDWQSVLTHAAAARANGFTVETVEFEGSEHVGHLKKDPVRYWQVVLNAWETAVSK